MSFRPIAPVPHGFSNINDYYKHTVEKTLKGEHCLDRPKCLGYLQFVIKKSPQSKLKQYLTAICTICGKKTSAWCPVCLAKRKRNLPGTNFTHSRPKALFNHFQKVTVI